MFSAHQTIIPSSQLQAPSATFHIYTANNEKAPVRKNDKTNVGAEVQMLLQAVSP